MTGKPQRISLNSTMLQRPLLPPAESIETLLAVERAALGAAILDVTGRQAGILAEFVEADNWVSSLNRSIFDAIRHRVAADQLPLDYSGLAAELLNMGVFQHYERVYSYLSSLGEGVILARPMTSRIAELRGLWRKRKESRDGDE